MSRKSIRTALCFSLAVVASASLTGTSIAQTKKVFDNSSTVGPGSELYGDRSNWIGDSWAGAFSPIGNDVPGGQGSANDLGFFGNPSTTVDGPITIRTDVYDSLSVGGWSFNSTTTAYSIQAAGTGSFMNVTLNGVNILTSNGDVSGSGNRILVVSDASTNDVVIGGGGTGFQTLNLTLGASQGEIYVKSGRSLTIGSSIAGVGKGITKTGSGVLLLSGQNTYTGETIVNAGTLRVSANDRLASGALTVDGSTAVFDLQGFTDSVGIVSLRNNATITGSTGTLTGSAYAFQSGTASTNLAGVSSALTKTTNGVVTMTGSNTYGGGTTLTEGTLRAGNNSAFGSGSIAINGGKISSNGATARAFTNNYTLGGNAELGDATDSGALTFSGAGTLTGNRILTINSDVTLSGAIGQTGGAQGLTKTGTGTLTLSGNNSFTGGTTVTSGSLALGANDRLADSGAVTVSGGAFDIGTFSDSVGAVTLTSGTITGSTGALTGTSYGVQSGVISANLSGTGALTKTTSGTVSINSATSYTGGTNVNAGTLQLGASNVLANAGAIDVNGGTLNLGTFSDNVAAVTLTSGSITGSGTLTGSSYSLLSGSISANLGGGANVTKSTSGTVILSGSNSSVGSVAISGGKLEVATGADLNAGLVTVSSGSVLDVDGVLSSSAGVTIDSGATLMGAGSIDGNVTVNGIINPGNSPGTLEVVGNLNLTASTILNFELLESNQVAGSGLNDLIDVDGNLVLDGTLNVPDPTTALTWTTSGTDLAPIKWTLFTFTGTLTDNGLTLGNLPTLLSGNSIPQLWQLNIVQNVGGGGSVNLQAVPEPSAAMLIGGILAGAACLRRRRTA